MKILFVSLGFIFLGIGLLGIAVPLLPTTPFLLLASFFFAKGSKKFHDWFLSTKIYKNHLESFVQSRAMTLKSKLTILIPVSMMLIVTFIFINNLHARIVIAVLFVTKYVYFFTRIKTIKESDKNDNNDYNKDSDKYSEENSYNNINKNFDMNSDENSSGNSNEIHSSNNEYKESSAKEINKDI